MSACLDITPGLPDQVFTTTIDDAPYVFNLRWNVRDSSWRMHIYEEDGITPVRLGMRVVLGTYLGRSSNHPLFTRGVFVVVDTAKTGREAGLDDLGARVQVVRYSLTEVLNHSSFDGRDVLGNKVYGRDEVVPEGVVSIQAVGG